MVKVKKQNILFALFASLLLIVLYAAFVSGDGEVLTTIHKPYESNIIYNLTFQTLQFNCSGNTSAIGSVTANITNVSLFGNWSGTYKQNATTNNLQGSSKKYNGTIISFNVTTNIAQGGPYVWNCVFYIGNISGDGATGTEPSLNATNATQNRSFTIDISAPTINVPRTDNVSNAQPVTGSDRHNI